MQTNRSAWFRLGRTREWLALGMLAALGQGATAAPAGGWRLDVPLTADFAPAAGPAAATPANSPATFVRENDQAFLRLPAPEAGSQPAVLATWPAREILSNAQGAVRFRIRCRKLDAKGGKPVAILRLVNPGGGEWTLLAQERHYAPPEKKETPVLGDKSDGLVAAGEAPTTAAALDEAPVATFLCAVRLKPFPENSLAPEVQAQIDTRPENGWHEVLWTWRSVNHDLYIDGKRTGGASAFQTLSRLAPLADPAARLELTSGAGVDLADLAVTDRWLAAPDAAPEPFRAWADWGWAIGRAVVYADAAGLAGAATVRAQARDAASGKAIGGAVEFALPGRFGEALLRLTDPEPLPAGTYRIEVTALAVDGKELGTARTEPLVVKVPSDWPWLGFQGGRRGQAKTPVIPPFTPLQLKDAVLSTVSVDYRIAASGFVDSVRTAGAEVLSGPLALRVLAAGQPLAFASAPGAVQITRTDTAADWQASATAAGGHRLNVTGHLEYDGVARFDVELAPQGTLALDGIELRLPLRPEVARVAHQGQMLWFVSLSRDAAGAWSTGRINWAGVKPERQHRPDVVFDSQDLYESLFPPPGRAHYSPYVHVGNYHRGLSWFVDNDRGWVHDPAGKIPPMEFVGKGDEVYLRLNVAAVPVTLHEPLRFRFYLLANPFKPLPPDWRTWEVGVNNKTNAIGRETKHRFWWHWNEYAESFKPYPGGGLAGKYEDWIRRFKNDEVYHTPFINFGSPGGFPLYEDLQSVVTPYTWKVHNTLPDQDYMCYWFDKCVRDIGIRGVYIDEPYCEPWSYNVLAGDAAYIKADGTRELGYRYMEGREYVRRFKQLFTDLGIDYSVWMHTTNYRALPVLTFADISMDGEHPSIWVPQFIEYNDFYCPERSAGYLTGAPFGMVGTQMFHGNTNPKDAQGVYYKSRTFLATTLAFGVLPMRCSYGVEWDRAENLRYAVGVFDPGIEDLTMNEFETWLPGAHFTPAFRGVAGLRNAPRHRALLFLNNTAEPRHTLDGDPAGLNLGKPRLHLWNAETGGALRVDDRIELELAPNDFAAVWVEGRDTPQVSRPRGALLGLSFDKGVEPDFGGGFLPATAENAAALCRDGGLVVSAAARRVRYPVVPAWAAGAVEFDLTVKKAEPAAPLRLLQLAHHLDATLAVVRKGESTGLLLRTREEPLPAKAISVDFYADGQNPKGKDFEQFVPLPATAQGRPWHVVLNWQCGEYSLFVDGQPAMTLNTFAAPRLRDAEAPAFGFILGDAGDAPPAAEARLDSLVLYDWPLTPALAAGKSPAVRPPAGEDFGVAWSALGTKQLRVVATCGQYRQAARLQQVRFSLGRPGADTKAQSVVSVVPWPGTAYAWHTFDLDMAVPVAGPARQLPGEDELQVGDTPAGGDKPWALRVELLGSEPDPATGKPKAVVLAAKTVEITIDALQNMELP